MMSGVTTPPPPGQPGAVPGQPVPPAPPPPSPAPPPYAPTAPQYAVPPQYGSTAVPGYGAAGVPPYGYQPAPTSPGGEPLAEFDKRLLAYVIDGLILGGASTVLLVPLYLCGIILLLRPVTTINGEVVGDSAGSTLVLGLLGMWLLLVVLALILSYVYHVELAWRAGGQTYGKRIAKVRVTPLNPAEPLTRRHLAIRIAAQLGLGLVPGLSLVDGLTQLWDKPYRQCLHDKAAKTVVVRLST